MTRTIRPPLFAQKSFTIDNADAAYAANDQVGTLQSVNVHEAAAWGVYLDSLVLEDVEENAPDIEIHIFNQSVTLADDNDPFTLVDGDASAWQGKVAIAAANWTNISGTKDWVLKTSLDRPIYLPGDNLYLAAKLISAGGETYSATSSISGYIRYAKLFVPHK